MDGSQWNSFTYRFRPATKYFLLLPQANLNKKWALASWPSQSHVWKFYLLRTMKSDRFSSLFAVFIFNSIPLCQTFCWLYTVSTTWVFIYDTLTCKCGSLFWAAMSPFSIFDRRKVLNGKFGCSQAFIFWTLVKAIYRRKCAS